MSEQALFTDADTGTPWVELSSAVATQRARAELVIALAGGRVVRAEDVVSAIDTPEGFDRRRFGPVVAALHRDGVIRKAGFAASSNPQHHAGIKQRWVLGTAEPCCPACGRKLGGEQ